MSGHPRSLVPFLTLLLAANGLPLLATSPAHAQVPGAADRATARRLAQEAYLALREKDFATSVDRYTRALALVHAPTLLRDLARAQVGLGRLVDAHENYSLVIREGVALSAPAPWQQALADARTELDALTPRLPWMTITVKGPAHPQVTIDGALIPEASLGVKRAADPGPHELRATAPGYYAVKKTISLNEGESVKVVFELRAAPPDAAPKPERETGKVSVATVVDSPWRTPLSIGAFTLGGAGIALGGVTGALAINRHKQLTADCPNAICGPSHKRDLETFHTLGTISTISFVAGGVAVGAGVVLLLVKPQSLVQQPSPSDRPTPARTSFSCLPFVGLRGAGVKGTF